MKERVKTCQELFCSLLVLLCMLPVSAFAEHFNFVSIKGLAEQEVGRLVLPQIYEKLGHTVTIFPLPGKRAQAEATSGRKDGEIMRIWTYGENNPSMVRVPTPYYSLTTMGFVKKGSGVVIQTKDDLAKYRIVKVRGVKHTDNITRGLMAEKVVDLDSTDQAMLSVLNNRADVALTNATDGLMSIKKFGFKELVPLEKHLAVLDLYNYIHRSKAGIASKVDATLKAMRESGELAEVIKKAEALVIQKYTNQN